MNIREITPHIFYAGVDDRTTTRFEGLWPLPYGVSYNSYIVRGEKCALIDCVEISRSADLIRHIHDIIGDTPLDYLVVNHMEPDHSGGIPVLLDHYPGLKLVGNRQTAGMLKGFYHVSDDRILEIADGDTLPLGNLSLQFYITPMVHWPETMMTYCPEEHVLFSGDAFGTFGALNGSVVDYELEIHTYIEEMYRYYSNIVGKYGRFVQNALKKTAGLDIDYICPTHGPVWHDNVALVVDITDRLSQYRSEPGVVIIYGSMYGNTAEVANSIARAISARGIKNVRVYDASYTDNSFLISEAYRYEGLIVGSPTYSMHLFPPVEQFMIAMETREVKGKVFAAFGNHTWSPVALKTLTEYGERMGMPPVATVAVKMSADAETEAAIELLADSFVANLTKE